MDIKLKQAVENLLFQCAGLNGNDPVLIVAENPQLGWYDNQVATVVLEKALALGLKAEILKVDGPEATLNHTQATKIEDHRNVIYFARIGDQDRFVDCSADKSNVMCYVRDVQMLQSAFGYTPYQALIALKDAINDVLWTAKKIEIRCPLGTYLSGSVQYQSSSSKDVTIKRFPLGVFKPVSAAGFSGQVALNRYLTSTGSQVYQPSAIEIEKPVIAKVESGQLIRFDGDQDTVSRVQSHYQMVSDQLGIDPNVVHSWHAGIHPGCSYAHRAAHHPDRWSNTIFNHPRFLHFHTCGDYPPGEICWMVLDHSIIVDDTVLWDVGNLKWCHFQQTNKCVENWPDLEALFESPSDKIGIAA